MKTTSTITSLAVSFQEEIVIMCALAHEHLCCYQQDATYQYPTENLAHVRVQNVSNTQEFIETCTKQKMKFTNTERRKSPRNCERFRAGSAETL